MDVALKVANIFSIMAAVLCPWIQDTQCTYDITLKRVRVTIVVVEKQ
jgi:hypothetical protein